MNNNGFITILSLTIMSIVLISVLYLIHLYSMEYMIINSTINSIQSSYFSEGKLYLVLNEKKYYNEVIPSIKKFLKDYYTTSIEGIYIYLDGEDLIGEDTNNLVIANIFNDYDGRVVLELSAKSTKNNITRKSVAKATVLNEIYELGMPIVSVSSLDEEKHSIFTEYMNFLEENIIIPDQDNDIHAIDITDFEEVKIKNDSDNVIVECYRNGVESPVRVEPIVGDSVFLLCKDESKTAEVYIMNLNPLDEFSLSGILYIEGNLIVRNDFQLDGILIANGNLDIDTSSQMIINGIMLYRGIDELIDNNNLKVNYNIEQMRKHVIYLPGFIDFNIRSIKSY